MISFGVDCSTYNMATVASRVYLGIRKPLTTAILLLQVLSLVSLIQCYQGDVSRGRLSLQLVRGPVVVSREENSFSQSAFSRRRERRDIRIGEEIALRVEGGLATECKAKGLVMCGDTCVEQCCNMAKGCMFSPFQAGKLSNIAKVRA